MKHQHRKSFVMHPSLRRGLLALSLSLAALPALADDDCDAPVERWQSREAVRQMAARQGWQIQRLKIDDGCYEIRGTRLTGPHLQGQNRSGNPEGIEDEARGPPAFPRARP